MRVFIRDHLGEDVLLEGNVVHGGGTHHLKRVRHQGPHHPPCPALETFEKNQVLIRERVKNTSDAAAVRYRCCVGY